jgi:hypothetical protein
MAGGLGAALVLSSSAESAAPLPASRSLARRRQQAVERCLQLIRNCQRPDGAIEMRLEREPTDPEDRKQAIESGEDPGAVAVDTVRVVPYFANHSALALLAAHARAGRNVEDVKRAARWLGFYAARQSPTTGYITDYRGSRSRGAFYSTGQFDSVDAYASTLLQLAQRYRAEVSGLALDERRELETLLSPMVLRHAATLALKAIESVTDADGLTWAKPDYKVKFLLDNVEVYGGLRAGEAFFAETGAGAEAAAARQQARTLERALDRFWQPERQRFAWAILEDGARQDGFTESYPHALANLAGLAWISGESGALWRALKQQFAPGIHAPIERWLMAAIGVGDADGGDWRQRTLEEAERFTARTNGQRTALLALVLCEGRSWMPNLAEERAGRAPPRP